MKQRPALPYLEQLSTSINWHRRIGQANRYRRGCAGRWGQGRRARNWPFKPIGWGVARRRRDLIAKLGIELPAATT